MEQIVQAVSIRTLASNVKGCVNVLRIFVTILQDVKVRFNICSIIKSKKGDFLNDNFNE